MTFGIASPWKDEALCARARELWGNRTASEIAGILWDEFRIPVTRCAVVGWLHREKLTIKDKTELHRCTSNAGTLKARIVRANSNARRIILTHEPAELKALRCAEIVPRGLTLLELEAEDCRYPYGESDFTFCGHPKVDGFSYCQPHANLTSVVPIKPTLAGVGE